MNPVVGAVLDSQLLKQSSLGDINSHTNKAKPVIRYSAGHLWLITAVVSFAQSFRRNKTANITYRRLCSCTVMLMRQYRNDGEICVTNYTLNHETITVKLLRTVQEA